MTPRPLRVTCGKIHNHGVCPAGGCSFALMDGSTRLITPTVDVRIFRALAGRNDGATISGEF